MTSKEALERISWRYVNEPSFQEWCNTIKQDLERLEKIENLRTTPNALEHCLADFMNKCMALEKENEKRKMAIEILKNYVAISKRRNEKYEYKPCIYSFGLSKDITQQEYELLKEVLE